MADIEQKAIGTNPQNHHHEHLHNRANTSNEVKAIGLVIECLSEDVALEPSGSLDLEAEKDVNKKFYKRFGDQTEEVLSEYAELLIMYKSKYELARSSVEISENRMREISVYLSRKSREKLQSNGGDFNQSLVDITEWLSERISESISSKSANGYSDNAIRFFVIKKIEECDVFPNPAKAGQDE